MQRPQRRAGLSLIKSGAVPVSTGIVRLEKRAEVPDLHKLGNFSKLTDNDNLVLAAA